MGGENCDALQSKNKGLAERLGADLTVWNLDRILRLPDTWNFKDRDNPVQVEIVSTPIPKENYAC